MLFEKQRIKLQKASIRYIIFIYFTLTALAASIFIGISLYSRLSGQMSATIREENQILINQITRSMEDYLRTVMKLSDSLYYGVVKNADLASGISRGSSPRWGILPGMWRRCTTDRT